MPLALAFSFRPSDTASSHVPGVVELDEAKAAAGWGAGDGDGEGGEGGEEGGEGEKGEGAQTKQKQNVAASFTNRSTKETCHPTALPSRI